MTSSSKLKTVCFAVIVVGLGVGIWGISYQGPTAKQREEPHSSSDPPSRTAETKAADSANVSAATEPDPQPVSKETLAVINAGKKSILDLAKTFEAKNSKVLYQKRLPHSEATAVAITAPNVKQIGELTDLISKIVNSADATTQDAVREELVKAYQDVVAYNENYKVLLLMSMDDGKSALAVADIDDLNTVNPTEDGRISLEGRTVYSLSEEGENGWKARYSHIFDIPAK